MAHRFDPFRKRPKHLISKNLKTPSSSCFFCDITCRGATFVTVTRDVHACKECCKQYALLCDNYVCLAGGMLTYNDCVRRKEGEEEAMVNVSCIDCSALPTHKCQSCSLIFWRVLDDAVNLDLIGVVKNVNSTFTCTSCIFATSYSPSYRPSYSPSSPSYIP